MTPDQLRALADALPEGVHWSDPITPGMLAEAIKRFCADAQPVAAVPAGWKWVPVEPTPGPWSLKTVPTSDGSCHKIGPFPSASRVHSETHACVYAIGIRLGIDDSTPIARELLANARLMAACSPENIAAILAHVEAQAAEIKRLRGLAMSTELFEDAPCFLCGYNGPGYFQPEQHSCAALYYERRREQR